MFSTHAPHAGKSNLFSSWISPFLYKLQIRALCPDSCHVNQFHTWTYALESWTKLRYLWPFCSEPSSNTPAKSGARTSETLFWGKPVVISHRCFKARTRVLTMCLSPNFLMPEFQGHEQIRKIQLPVFSHFCTGRVYLTPSDTKGLRGTNPVQALEHSFCWYGHSHLCSSCNCEMWKAVWHESYLHMRSKVSLPLSPSLSLSLSQKEPNHIMHLWIRFRYCSQYHPCWRTPTQMTH